MAYNLEIGPTMKRTALAVAAALLLPAEHWIWQYVY